MVTVRRSISRSSPYGVSKNVGSRAAWTLRPRWRIDAGRWEPTDRHALVVRVHAMRGSRSYSQILCAEKMKRMSMSVCSANVMFTQAIPFRGEDYTYNSCGKNRATKKATVVGATNTSLPLVCTKNTHGSYFHFASRIKNSVRPYRDQRVKWVGLRPKVTDYVVSVSLCSVNVRL